MAASDNELRELARLLGERLHARGAQLASAESCTGGWLAKTVTDLPRASKWFGWGFVTYANAAKAGMLGVPAELIDTHGAVSEPVVRAMAEGARAASGADLAVAVTGIAGPGGGTLDKPVGTVWFGWAAAGGTFAERMSFAGDRDAVRRQSVAHALRGALDMLERGTL
jgi:nicotinamide-nucleotide amidase